MVTDELAWLRTDQAASPEIEAPLISKVIRERTGGSRCGMFRANGEIVQYGRVRIGDSDIKDIARALQPDEIVILIPEYWYSVFLKPSVRDVRQLSEEGIRSIPSWVFSFSPEDLTSWIPATAWTQFLAEKAAWTITKNGLRKVRQKWEVVEVGYRASSPLYYATAAHGDVRFIERKELLGRLENVPWADTTKPASRAAHA